MNRLKRIWARTTGHLMGHTDDDHPSVPILSQKDANISLALITLFVLLNVTTNIVIIANAIHHW